MVSQYRSVLVGAVNYISRYNLQEKNWENSDWREPVYQAIPFYITRLI